MAVMIVSKYTNFEPTTLMPRRTLFFSLSILVLLSTPAVSQQVLTGKIRQKTTDAILASGIASNEDILLYINEKLPGNKPDSCCIETGQSLPCPGTQLID
jgi:hypothetical protein